METADEDLDLFLEELGNLLNKYHYSMSEFRLGKFVSERILTCRFDARGDGYIIPMAFVPQDLIDNGE